MAVYPLHDTAVRQPLNVIFPINRKNPITKGLRRVINCGNLLHPIDLISGISLTYASLGPNSVAGTRSNYGLRFNNNQNGISFPTWTSTGEASLFILQKGDQDNTTSGGWLELGSSSNVDHFPYVDIVYSDVFWSSRWINGVAPPTGKFYTIQHSIGISVRDGRQVAYWDEIPWVTASNTGGFTLPGTGYIGGNGSGSWGWYGTISCAYLWDRALTDAELLSLSKNPWQIFEDPFAAWYYTATGGGGVSGTLAVTLGNTTSAASGTSTILGTLAQNLSAVTSAIAGTTTVLGALSLNLAATTLAASGSVGSPVSGTVTETLDDTTLSASGTTTILGTVSQTLANTTISAAGATTVLGSVNNTLANTTLSASGSVGGAVSGSVGLTLANTTLAASGTTTLLGTVNYTTENTVLAAQGTTSILGSLGVTLANTTLVATGTSGSVTSAAAWRFLKLWLSKLGV